MVCCMNASGSRWGRRGVAQRRACSDSGVLNTLSAAKALVQPHSAAENAAEADVLAKAERPDGSASYLVWPCHEWHC